MNLIDRIVSKKRNIFIFLIIIAVISSITLFLIPNMSRGHDLAFHLSRISAIKDNLKLGIIGGYIYPNYLSGYGYGNGLFYPDLFLYIPAFLSYLGLNVITSYKVFIFLINFASIFTMYYAVNKITNKKKCALLSAMVYGFSAYRLVDVFTRAALGESLSFVFAPLIILGMYEIIYQDYKKFYILVIGMSGLLLSHLISTYMIGILLVIFCLINIKKFWKEKKRIGYLALAAIITLLLTSYFIFPMLEQMISGEFYFNNLTETSQLLKRSLPIWSIFIEFPNHILVDSWIPCGIGLGFVILIICYIKNRKNTSSFVHFCFITAIVLMFCSTNLFPWNIFQTLMSPIQFPWRLFFLVTLLVSIGGGILFKNVELKVNKKAIVMCIIFFVPIFVVSGLNFTEPNIDEVGAYEISFGEYMPTPANRESVMDRGNVIMSEQEADYSFERKGTSLEVVFNNNHSENKLELPILYYKGYSATLDGKNLKIYKTENGLVGIEVPSVESGNIYIRYTGTMIQTISKTVSFISVILFSIFVIIIKKRGVV